MTLNGGTASSLDKYPRFKIISIDKENFTPHKITSYIYDVDLASEDQEAEDYDVIFTQMILPDYFDRDMDDLSPSSFFELAKEIKDSESKAIVYKE